MADRYPLIVDSSTNTVKEIASGDNLDLEGSGIVDAANVKVVGVTTSGSFEVSKGAGIAATAVADVRIEGSASFNRIYMRRPGDQTANTDLATGSDSQPGALIYIENDRKVAVSTNFASAGIGTTLANDSFYIGAGSTYLSGSICVGIGSTSPKARLDLTAQTHTGYGQGALTIRASNSIPFIAGNGEYWEGNSGGVGNWKGDSFNEFRHVASGYFNAAGDQPASILHGMLVHLNENNNDRRVFQCTSQVGFGNSAGYNSINDGSPNKYFPIFNVTSDGRVGVNTNAPGFALDVWGVSPGVGAFRVQGDATVGGALSKGSGSFNIPHPLLADKRLVHSFVEGPRADLIYRGKVTLAGGTASVNMDTEVGLTAGTWEALCRDAQVFVQNNAGWTAVKGTVSGATLTVTAQDPACVDEIDWMVVAERQDENIKGANWTDADGRPILEADPITGEPAAEEAAE